MPESLTKLRETKEQPAVQSLVAHLRERPYRTDYSAKELADRLGLDEKFVSDVLETLKGSPNRYSSSESLKRAMSSTIKGVAAFFKSFTEDFVNRPYVSLPLTLVVGAALIFAVRWMAVLGLLGKSESAAQAVYGQAMAIIAVAVGLLHGASYFKHGMMRLVVYGSFCTVLTLFGSLLLLDRSSIAPYDAEALGYLVLSVFSALVYFAAFGIVSLFGGFRRSSLADRRDALLTRQELLDRLFHLQRRLDEIQLGTFGRRRRGLIEVMRATPWLPVIGLAVGAIVGGCGVIVRGSSAELKGTIENMYGSVPMIAVGLDMVVTSTAFVSLGYLSGGLRRSLVALILFFVGKLCAELVPYGFFGPAYLEWLVSSGKLLFGLELTVVFATLLGIGSHIDARARVRQKLKDEDPAVVLAEYVEIQWRLNPTQSATCVMVVDVAGSTSMKQDADAFSVEYSFRAFQEFISAVSCRRGGAVLSQAGDGAVVSFKSCIEALYAAKEIQTEIAKFNAQSNRLDTPFRLRIGIHSGQTAADLKAVPFNELIDIAAHVERESPVGGIAVTESVIKLAEGERVAAMMDKVDGQSVFIVLNPTLVS